MQGGWTAPASPSTGLGTVSSPRAPGMPACPSTRPLLSTEAEAPGFSAPLLLFPPTPAQGIRAKNTGGDGKETPGPLHNPGLHQPDTRFRSALSPSLSGLTERTSGFSLPRGAGPDSRAATMLAPGSGPELSTWFAPLWRQISCEWRRGSA